MLFVLIALSIFIFGFLLGALRNKIKRFFQLIKDQGLKATLKKVLLFIRKKLFVQTHVVQPQENQEELHLSSPSVREDLQSLLSVEDKERINLVLDDFDLKAFYHVSQIPVLIAAHYAQLFQIPLRIISRNNPVNTKNLRDFLQTHQISLPKELEIYSDYEALFGKKIARLEVSKKDLFITTSEATAIAIKKINLSATFFYIHQNNDMKLALNRDHWNLQNNLFYDPSIVHLMSKDLMKNSLKNRYEGSELDASSTFNLSTLRKIKRTSPNKNLVVYNAQASSLPVYLPLINEALLKDVISPDWNLFLSHKESKPDLKWIDGRLIEVFPSAVDGSFEPIDLLIVFQDSSNLPPLAEIVLQNDGVVLSNCKENENRTHFVHTNRQSHEWLEYLQKALTISSEQENWLEQNNCLKNVDQEHSLVDLCHYIYKNR